MPKYRIIPVGGGGITPEGTLEIRSEGVFDVTDYAAVDVDIFDDTTTKNITLNGTYNAEDDHVLGYSQVTVDVPASAVDTGTLTIEPITQNVTLFTQDVTGYRAVAFQVDVQPTLQAKSNIDPTTSSKTITADQNYDGLSSVQINAVTASVDANITAGNIKNGVSILGVTGSYTGEGIIPTGTLQITRNGIQDVTQYASVDVNVASSDTDFFCIEANAASSVQFNKKNSNGHIYYSSDKTNWTEVVSSTNVNLAQGDKLYCYGDAQMGTSDSNTCNKITLSGDVTLSGQLMTLCSPNGGEYAPNYGFSHLFMSSSARIDASRLVLPMHTGEYSFSYLFYSCTNLVAAPAFPSTETDTGCYQYTFGMCASLSQAPALPATNISPNAYQGMFDGCSNLASAPDLSNIVYVSTDGMSYMFRDCLSITSIKFSGKLYQRSINYICSGCTALQSADLSGVTYIGGSNACSYAFNGCTSLNIVVAPNIDSWNTSYFNSWLSNVSQTGTFIKQDITIPTGSNGIPSGWLEVNPPTISIDYTNLSASITTDVSGATIYYSTNDSDTPNQFTQYTGNISIPSGLNYYPIRAYVSINSIISYISDTPYCNYFYIESNGDGSVSITLSNDYDMYPASNTQISTDRVIWTAATSIPSISNSGERVYFRRKQNPGTNPKFGVFSGYFTISGTGTINAGGCISSLCYNTTKPNQNINRTNTFRYLFQNVTNIVDASNIILDLSGISDYQNTFYAMFSGCTSLTGALDLSSITSVTYGTLESLYKSCSSLATITAPNVSSWGTSYFTYWVYGVSPTGTIYAPTGVTIPTGTNGIPSGWTRVDY